MGRVAILSIARTPCANALQITFVKPNGNDNHINQRREVLIVLEGIIQEHTLNHVVKKPYRTGAVAEGVRAFFVSLLVHFVSLLVHCASDLNNF